ncbi:UPF0179 family protein [Geoglobus acetivorans]|uniref:UPF0179 protein LPQ35_01350 n=1 Tax=Geoglobus acetivorans TaxID=565033 RepID=A0ABZ3H393_GEOAI|nr:UPF0179 family protein [Geoglobus acetivorans]
MENEVNKIVTLCGKDWAITGIEFTFVGGSQECEQCRLKKVCLKLRIGSKYKIVGVRNGEVQPCQLHDDGVIAVEVVELPLLLAVDSKMAVEGAVIRINGNCSNVECSFFNICNPSNIGTDESLEIVGVGEAFECPKGKTMRVVEVSRS